MQEALSKGKPHPASPLESPPATWISDCWICGSGDHLQRECTVARPPFSLGSSLRCVAHGLVRAHDDLFWSRNQNGWKCVRCSLCR
jgi:hypothetical protein